MTRRQFNLRLNADLIQPLDEMAATRQTSKTNVVNAALREYFEKYEMVIVEPEPVEEPPPIRELPDIVFLSRFDDDTPPLVLHWENGEAVTL